MSTGLIYHESINLMSIIGEYYLRHWRCICNDWKIFYVRSNFSYYRLRETLL